MRGLDVWKLSDFVVTTFMVYLVEELATFGYIVGVFLPRKFKLILRIFYLVSQRM